MNRLYLILILACLTPSVFIAQQSSVDNEAIPEELKVLTNSVIDFEYLVYPNPSSGQVTLLANQEVESVVVYDVSGEQVLSQLFNLSAGQLDLSLLSKGNYHIEVKNKNGNIGVENIILE